MSVNKDFFQPDRAFNYDFESAGKPATGWRAADRVPEALVPTHCAFCGVQCGMNLRVLDGQVIGVEPRDFPHNRGSLCPKGVVAYQQVNHPDRLRYPMMRRGGKGGRLERASWDEALDYIVSRWQQIQAEHGKDAVAIYSGSSMTNEKCYIMGKFARVGLGTRHVDYNGRLCMSSAAVAYARAFGVDRAPLPMTDIPLTDCMLAVGVNVGECFPIMMQWIWRARDKGASLIVIDPRETPLARTADLWLPVRPGTDIAVLNAMLRQLIVDGLIDEEYLRARTNGWEEVRASVEPFTLEFAEKHSGVPAKNILAAARLYGRAARSLVMHARGIEHSTHGVNNCLACINLALARGQLGKPGSGCMMVTGQGNGQGGREVGQKANQLPGYRHIDVPEDRDYIANVWGIPVDELPWEGAAATEMIHLMADGEIRSCMIVCSNPMVSLPDNRVVQQALERIDPLIVVDFFLSETAELADIILPGTVWCEDEGTTTNLEGRVIKINQAADPPGEALQDWKIVTELAKRLGRGKFFPFESVSDIWNEYRVASKGGVSDYYGITWEKIDEQGGVFWPCPSLDHPGTPRLFTERFGHPDGKARMFPIPYAPPAEEPGGDYPFCLTTGRVVYHYLSGNQTRRLGFLNDQAPEPWVEIHPQAAAKLGIVNDEIVRVRTPRFAMEVKALVVPTIRPDTLFIPYHYGHERSVNQLTNPAVEPNVKIPEYKACAATVEKLNAPAVSPGTDGVIENFTPENAPRMFPYTIGETKDQPAKDAKTF
ncbi:MAG TPA: molybdopterin oxidoreductase family protein [Ktedonobacteraceae bacterium]|jgi:assimilatory nitrate reductase catalytic subunit|nr:molybdopterin oxidoreductase family protein [Ktedonobacteraceae bacterium]